MKPKNQFVEIIPAPAETKVGSIILPGSANSTTKKGTIKSFSDQLKDLNVGDKVIYFKRGIVAEFPDSGTEFIRFDQILCIE